MKTPREKFPTVADVYKQISSGAVQPLYVLFGDEDFLIDECITAIIESLVPKELRAFNVDIAESEKVSANDVISLANAYPMMADRRVVVVKDFLKLSSTERERELLLLYIQKPLLTTCFIMVCEKKPDFRLKLFSELKRLNCVYEFPRYYESQVPSWIEDRCRKYGKSIELEAVQFLCSIVGTSLRSLANELDKIVTYVGERDRIYIDDVSRVVGYTKGNTVFDLQRAIGKRETPTAFSILKRLLEAGESPQGLLVMLTRYTLQLLKVKELLAKQKSEGEIASEITVPHFFVKEYIDAAKNYSFSNLESAIIALRNADLVLKTTSVDVSHVMELLLYSLLQSDKNKTPFSVFLDL